MELRCLKIGLIQIRKFFMVDDNASEGYILGTGMATSATLPLWVPQLATIL
jgi:hypothetical protein